MTNNSPKQITTIEKSLQSKQNQAGSQSSLLLNTWAAAERLDLQILILQEVLSLQAQHRLWQNCPPKAAGQAGNKKGTCALLPFASSLLEPEDEIISV